MSEPGGRNSLEDSPDLPSATRSLSAAHAGESGTSAPLLRVEKVSHSFGAVRAVAGATFSVSRTGITGLIGPNGAGKSSVVGIICGNLRASDGEVHFDGRDITSKPAYLRARWGLIRMFQLSSDFSRLTVIENLLVAGQRQPGERLIVSLLGGRRAWRKREEELLAAGWDLLARFGLADKANDYAQTLSGGQKRVLELMRALMASPKLLVLDEPLAGVSPALADELTAHLLTLKQEGLAMLLIEHELDVVERLCDHVVAMAEGRVIAEGAMSSLRKMDIVQKAYSFG